MKFTVAHTQRRVEQHSDTHEVVSNAARLVRLCCCSQLCSCGVMTDAAAANVRRVATAAAAAVRLATRVVAAVTTLRDPPPIMVLMLRASISVVGASGTTTER